MARTKRNQSAPNPASDQATQDQDPAISPAPTELPKATPAKQRDSRIKNSVEKGKFVTVLRKSSVNGRTLTGVLHVAEEASGEGENATEAVYVLRTGQPGRPARLKASDIQTIVLAEPPLTVAEAEDTDAS